MDAEKVVGFTRQDDGTLMSYDGTLIVSRETFIAAADHVYRNYLVRGTWERASAEMQFVWSEAALAIGLGGNALDITEWHRNENFKVAAEIFRTTLNELIRQARAEMS